MKESNKLAKRGWSNAMIHQRTLSLILTLDNLLISGPHVLLDDKQKEDLQDPNVFFVKSKINSSNIESELDKESNKSLLTNVHTYYIMRSFIRGILFGLNPLYQISLFVPCSDPKEIHLYKEIISMIDIGGQFFQDRIYWNLESLQRDIMDERLACLIHVDNTSFVNDDWIKKISIETRPFVAKIDRESGINNNLFDLVEMRSFLEEMHQMYFSRISESKSAHFVNMIKFYMSEKNNKTDYNNMLKVNMFYSVNNGIKHVNHIKKPFNSDRYSLKKVELKTKNGFSIFKNPTNSTKQWNNLNANLLIEEYQNIIIEQLKINHQMNRDDIVNERFTNLLYRWNMITLRKSEILKTLVNDQDSLSINEKLRSFNETYFHKRYMDRTPDSDIFRSTQSGDTSHSETDDSSCYLIISNRHESDIKDVRHDLDSGLFTTWYTK